ncbi:MAG: dynamin family protein [Burkholderiaceae bacterium]
MSETRSDHASSSSSSAEAPFASDPPSTGFTADDSSDGLDHCLRMFVDAMPTIPGLAGPAFDGIRRKLERRTFNVLVAGEFKRGKSSLINAMLGAQVLPTGVVPVTSIVTLLQNTPSEFVEVAWESGRTERVPMSALPDYVTESGNPKNRRGVWEVIVGFPTPWLDKEIRLVDSPGVGSVFEQNTKATQQFLPQADAVIFVASADQPMSRNELDFLDEIRRFAGRTFIVLNKIDRLSDEEIVEAITFSKAAIHEAAGTDIAVYPVSSRDALRGRSESNAELLERSRLPVFEAALRGFLARDRDVVWAQSIRGHMRRLLEEVRLAAEIELRALDEPLDTLAKHLDLFAEKKRELLQITADSDALLAADTKKLMTGLVEADLARFLPQLRSGLGAMLEIRFSQGSSEGSAALKAELEEYTSSEIRRQVDTWLAAEEQAVDVAFNDLLQRHWNTVESAVADLLRDSARMFSIAVPTAGVGSLWRQRIEFQYRFWTEPASLTTLRNAFLTVLPVGWAGSTILRDAQRRADDLADMHCGRLRHEFDKAIRRNVQQFRDELAARTAAVIDGLQGAIENGLRLQSQGRERISARRSELESTLARLCDIRARVDGDQGPHITTAINAATSSKPTSAR